MSVYDQGVDVTLGLAYTDLSAKQYCAVKLTANGVESAGTAGQSHGVLQNAPTAGQAAVVRVSGISKVKYGASVTVGDKLIVEATTTQYIPLPTSGITDNAKYMVGVALVSGADLDIGMMLVTPPLLSQSVVYAS